MKPTIGIALLLLAFLFIPASVVQAQSKIGWINSAAILDKLPEAQDAQRQSDKRVVGWQSELAKMQNLWVKKKDEYDKKNLILADQLRAEAEKELEDLD